MLFRSPKLENSAMTKEKRHNEDALFFIKKMPHCFKFVVYDEEDIIDTFEEYGFIIKGDEKNVYIMPASTTRDEFIKVSKVVGKLAIKWGLNFSPRLQLLIWNRCVGV